MKVDLLPLETWETLNGSVKRSCAVADDVSVRVFSGLSAAIYDVAQGTAQFLSHKRSLALVQGQTFVFQPLLPYFYKEAYMIQTLPAHKLAEMNSWIESLKKDTLFVLLAEDHPVTGEKFDWEEADRLLNEKRIFCIRVSHNTHFYDKQEVRPYSVRVCSFSPQAAVAFCGNKFKSPPLMAPSSYWIHDKVIADLKLFSDSKTENPEVVKKFEANLPAGFSPFLKTEKRLYDRAVIYTTEANGEALQQGIASSLNLQVAVAGFEARLETTSLCRWGGTKNFDGWWDPLPDKNVLRGMLIIDAQLLAKSDIKGELEKAFKQCRIGT